MSHFHPDKVHGLLSDIESVIQIGGGYVTLSTSFMSDSTYFEATYWISEKTTEEELIAVALGIWLDYQYRYETFQGKMYLGAPRLATSFSPEDLPTDYLAFVSAAKNMSADEIFSHLGGMQAKDKKPLDYYLFQNKTHQPLIIVHDRFGLPIRAEHTSWPRALTITPVGSDSGLWRFEKSRSMENWKGYLSFLIQKVIP